MDVDSSTKKPRVYPPHYHGDIVRKLFILGGVIMMATLPIFSELINLPVVLTVLVAVLIVFLAGFQNPSQRWVTILNTLVAMGACVVFEYVGISYFRATESVDPFFLTNQALAFVFLVALYFSSKTFRGAVVKEK